MAKNPGETKRSLADSVVLWGTACLVVGLGVGFFWVSDELHFEGKWRLYLLLNVGFCGVVIWRFRTWFNHWGSGLLLTAWLAVHLVVYGFLTRLDFNLFFCIFLFPAEAMVLLAVGQVVRARHRENELRQVKRG